VAKIHTSRRSFKALGHVFVAFFYLAGLQIVQDNMVTAVGADIDSEYRDPSTQERGWQIVIIKDQSPSGQGDFSYLVNTISYQTCSSLSDPACAGGIGALTFNSLLPVCTSSAQLDCIIEFGSVDAGGVNQPAVYFGTFPTSGNHDFTGDSSVLLPNGGPPTLWSVPALGHAGGSQYLVKVNVEGGKNPGIGEKFKFSRFNIEINPIELVSDPCILGGQGDENCTIN